MELNLPDFERQDHRDHAVYGLALAGVAHVLHERFNPDAELPARIIIPIAVAFLAGAAKEVIDNQGGGHCELGDALATGAGGLVLAINVGFTF